MAQVVRRFAQTQDHEIIVYSDGSIELRVGDEAMEFGMLAAKHLVVLFHRLSEYLDYDEEPERHNHF